MVLWRELYTCCLLPGTAPEKVQATTDYMMEFMERLLDIHHEVHQLINIAR
jgi:hypothetical protein